jgi:hypothetical protein
MYEGEEQRPIFFFFANETASGARWAKKLIGAQSYGYQNHGTINVAGL